VTIGGYLGDQVPPNNHGFVEFARSLPKPEIFDVVKVAEPLSPLMPYQFSANMRRRYEELPDFPEGFLVFADAICSFNPIYGQGMTVACLEALALDECLTEGTHGLAARFFRAATRLIDVPWQIAVNSDLQHPGVKGRRTLRVHFINWYIAQFYYAGQYDGVLATRFVEVANLMRQPEALFAPSIALRVWKRNWTTAVPKVLSKSPFAVFAVGTARGRRGPRPAPVTNGVQLTCSGSSTGGGGGWRAPYLGWSGREHS
jgi:hypothetical protein